MKSEGNPPKAAEVVAHPVILRGAWLRVDTWYRRGEFAPQPELSRWRLYPEAMLRNLASALRDGSWKPEQWRQVPYPKEGARLRHYVMPTVRDQVAFMAHMVALGPILDQQLADFVLGNRWHRPIAWDSRHSPARWVHCRYPVLSNRIYLSDARSHGLFRRAAHWTVARMTNAMLPRGPDPQQAHLPEDYPDESLPEWTNAEWWQGTSGPSRAHWAHLDIELAFPSVRVHRLAKAMERALSESVEPRKLFDGCPGVVLEALRSRKVRVEIGRRLTKALRQVTVDAGRIPLDSWIPPEDHSLPKVLPYEGLPTGLAVSRMLLNVALCEADREIESYLVGTSGNERGAIVRFADEMYVLSRSSHGLLSLIEAVHGALSGNHSSSLAVPNEESNICINYRKIGPDPVREVIGAYLLDHGWAKCTGCDQPLPPSSVQHFAPGISHWWDEPESQSVVRAHRDSLERTAIERGDVDPFVTSLIERLSDMGTETLRDRFGDRAREYLARLHELARFDIEDEQVQPDTRRTFSVNQLVRARLPKSRDVAEERTELRQIRETLGFVLDRTPWNFVLWRTVVRGAARRPLGSAENDWAVDKESAKWLSNLLRRISCAAGPRDPASWLTAWPDVDAVDKHDLQRSGGWQELYLSFHRAAFWHYLAEVVRELTRHAARLAGEEMAPSLPSPDLWSARAVPDWTHEQAAAHLGRIEKWVNVLYPGTEFVDLTAWPWELDEFVGAVLAVHTTVELAEAWRRTPDPGPVLQVPATGRLRQMPKVSALLSSSGRLCRKSSKRDYELDYWRLANVQMGQVRCCPKRC